MFRKCRRAFSLLELALVLVIVAVIIGLSVTAYKSQIDNIEVKNTYDKIQAVKTALDAFFKANNRLPCPADGTILPGAANYGVEVSSCPVSPCPGGMLCGANVVTGTVPFVTLGLSDQFGSDPWLSRLSYAVDNIFTQPNGNCESGGKLTVMDYNDNVITNTAVYAVISHGRDFAGAYNVEGGTLRACNTTNKDGENCDGDDIFRTSEIKINTTVGTDHYDDIALWSANPNLKTCPAGLRDCRLWLDSSDRCTITLGAGGVAEWRSKGVSIHRATQGAVSEQPSYVTASGSLINGRPYVRFVSGDIMYVSDIVGDTPISTISDSEYTQVVVFRTSSADGTMMVITDSPSFGAGAFDRWIAISGGNVQHYNYNGLGTETLVTPGTYTDSLPHIAISSTSASSPHKFWVDGTLIASGVDTLSGFNWKTNIIIGGHFMLGYYEDDILEVMYFDYVLSNEERKLLETYMAKKWGINGY